MRAKVKANASRIVLGTVIGLAVGEIILFSLLIPALGKLVDQAHRGDAARQRQIQSAPVGCANARDLYVRGKITRRQLEQYVAGALAPCPIPTR